MNSFCTVIHYLLAHTPSGNPMDLIWFFVRFNATTIEMPQNWSVAIISSNKALINLIINTIIQKPKFETFNWSTIFVFFIRKWLNTCAKNSVLNKSKIIRFQPPSPHTHTHIHEKLNNFKLCVFDLLALPSLCWTEKKNQTVFSIFIRCRFFIFKLKYRSMMRMMIVSNL